MYVYAAKNLQNTWFIGERLIKNGNAGEFFEGLPGRAIQSRFVQNARKI